MLKNYFIVAFRNFRHNKVFSVINILGLAIGISAALVIYLIVSYDFSFDTFHKDGDRIYRVVTDMKFSGEPFKNSGVPQPLPGGVRKELTGIEESAAFSLATGIKVSVLVNDNSKPNLFRNQSHVVFADEHYFKLFPFYKWLAGSPQFALNEPFQVVLTESRAKTYFPGVDLKNVIGREIIYDDSIKTSVAGVVLDPDQTTDFTFKEFISLDTKVRENMWSTEWGAVSSGDQFFVKLAPASISRQINTQLASLEKKYNTDDQRNSTNSIVYRLQPLSDIHFNNGYDNFDQRMAHKPTLYGLLLVALFLLLLGCINFVNLTTAQASQRAKEIGIRKTMGGSKTQLVFQFLIETFLLTISAALLSALFTPWLLHIFADFIPPELHFDILQQPHILGFLLGLIVLVSLLSGFYPAWILSRFKPVLVLKNQAFAKKGGTRKAWVRKTLTVSQFVIAQFFVMATLVVSKQIHYALNKDLGFKRNAIVNFNTPFHFRKPDPNRNVLVNRIKSIPEIALISESNPPASMTTMSQTIKYQSGKKEIETDVQIKMGDTNYLRLYGMKLLAGKNLNQSDSIGQYLINETYAKILGFKNPNDAVGTMLGEKSNIPVIGVVSDFHQKSIHETIKPLAIVNAGPQGSTTNIGILLRPGDVNGKSWKNGLEKIEKIYKELYPEEDFKYEFFDESIAAFYKSDQNISRLLKWATGLAIFISCLGLLGLVMYTTILRIKEISVRKVLGASVSQLVTILSADFIRLVFIAFIVATPLAWWVMNKWLEDFAYRTALSWWLFPVSGLIIILIALITLSIQTIRTAVANPINALRSE